MQPTTFGSPTTTARATVCGIGVGIAWLMIALWLAQDFGPSLDLANGDYAYGHRTWAWLTGRGASILDAAAATSLPVREPAPLLIGVFPWFQLYPLASTMSAASAELFYHRADLLPPFVALHLPILLAVGLLAVGIFRTLGSRLGLGVALGSLLLLLTAPRFLAHALANLKDAPEAALYVLAALAGFEALAGRRRLSSWLATGVLAGLALAQKANVLFLPVHLALFLGASLLWTRVRGRQRELGLSPPGLVAGLVAFVLTWLACRPDLWADTWNRAGRHFGELLRVARAPGTTGLEWGGVEQLLCTTPVVLLLFGLVGIFAPGPTAPVRIFLVTGLAVPVLRTVPPGTRNFDGVRHFLEFYPFLAVLAACGAAATAAWLTRRAPSRSPARGWVRATVLLLVAAPGVHGAVTCWPALLTYHDPFVVGGFAGARERGLPDASDYWALTYWQGLDWIQQNAAPGATVVVPVAPQVARCAAPVRAPDHVVRARVDGSTPPPDVLFVMYVTRRRLYDRYTRGLEADGGASVVHRLVSQGADVLRIHRFEGGNEIARQLADLGREARARRFFTALAARLQATDPELGMRALLVLRETPVVGEERTIERLEAMLPAELHANLPDVVWSHAK